MSTFGNDLIHKQGDRRNILQPLIVEKGSELPILLREMREHFGALSAALTVRDQQLSAISESIRHGFVQQDKWNSTFNSQVAHVSQQARQFELHVSDSMDVIGKRFDKLESMLTEQKQLIEHNAKFQDGRLFGIEAKLLSQLAARRKKKAKRLRTGI